MGVKCARFHGVTVQPPQACTAMIEMDHKPFGLLTPGLGLMCFWMIGRDACFFQKSAQPQDLICIQEGMMQPCCCVQHHRFAAWQFQFQSVIR